MKNYLILFSFLLSGVFAQYQSPYTWPEMITSILQGFQKQNQTLTAGTYNAELGTIYHIDLQGGDVIQTLPDVVLADTGKMVLQNIYRANNGTTRFLTIFADTSDKIIELGDTIFADGLDSRWLQVINDNGNARYSGISYSNLDIIKAIDVTRKGDDRGLTIQGQLAVGDVGVGGKAYELIVGGGDSYPLCGGWHCNVSGEAGDVYTGCTDVTTELQSDSASPVSLFGGLTAGSFLLVKSRYAGYAGAKVKIVDALTPEPANIVGEFRQEGVWNPVPFMAINDDTYPAKQYGWNLANEDSTSEQWRFGFNPLELPTVWEKDTITVNGTEQIGWFARLRVVSDITQQPNIEQVKLHTDRAEINPNGRMWLFGEGRKPVTLMSGLFNTTPNDVADPANEDVDYAPGFTIKYQDNEFASNAIDGFTFQQGIVLGLDTSIPLVVQVSYYVKGTGTGIVDLDLDVIGVGDGFVYDGTGVAQDYAVQDTITTNSNLIRRTSTFTVLINAYTFGDELVFNLIRNSLSGNPDDTLPHSIIITNIKVIGYLFG